VDKLIFTKLDEAKHCGAGAGIVRSVRKPLSYVTTGQGVPADIEVARGKTPGATDPRERTVTRGGAAKLLYAAARRLVNIERWQ